MNLSEKIGCFVENIEYDKLSDEVILACKTRILDLLGIAISASKTKHCKLVINLLRKLNAPGDSAVWGQGFRTNELYAALANGVLGHGVDFDDAHKFVHPGCSVIPTAFAIGDKVGSSGKDLIAAIVAGYEVSIWVSLAAGIKHRKRGFHPTGTCNAFGAAAVAGKLLALNGEQLANALGIAGTMSAGLTQYRFDGSDIKRLHGGKAAHDGVFSGLLSATGFVGSKEIFEGENGFLNTMADGGEEFLPSIGSDNEFQILNTDIKPYPACRQIHGPIEMALALKNKFQIDPNDISMINIKIYEYAAKSWLISKSMPVNTLQAQLNIPYCIAAALINNKLTLEELFYEENFKDIKINELAQKINVVAEKEFSSRFPAEKPSEIAIYLKDGRKYSQSLTHPKGTRENPCSLDDVVKKFKCITDYRFTNDKQERLIDIIIDLNKFDNIREVTNEII